MTTALRPLTLSGIAFAIAAIWTAVVFTTGIGARIYILPVQPIAEILRPCEAIPQPFVPTQAKTPEEAFGELIVHAMFACLPQGMLALLLAATFWLVIVPAAVFAGFWFRKRSYG